MESLSTAQFIKIPKSIREVVVLSHQILDIATYITFKTFYELKNVDDRLTHIKFFAQIIDHAGDEGWKLEDITQKELIFVAVICWLIGAGEFTQAEIDNLPNEDRIAVINARELAYKAVGIPLPEYNAVI